MNGKFANLMVSEAHDIGCNLSMHSMCIMPLDIFAIEGVKNEDFSNIFLC